MFEVQVGVRPGKDLADVEKNIYAELDRLKAAPVEDWELEKVRMASKRGESQQLESTLFRAIRIGQMAVYYNDPNLINTRPEKIQSITKEDIQRVAKTYLTPENRTVVVTLPKSATVALKGAN